MLIFIFICDDDANIKEDGEINEDANICRSRSRHGEGFLASDYTIEQFDRQEFIGTQRKAAQPFPRVPVTEGDKDTPNFPKTPLTHNPNKYWIERLSLINPAILSTRGKAHRKS
jgi:hypothetical protein